METESPRLSDMQAKCLHALASGTAPHGEMCWPFRPIEEATGLPRKDVRRSVRALFRKGLAEFHKGLCNEDGYFAGSGYCISLVGLKVTETLRDVP